MHSKGTAANAEVLAAVARRWLELWNIPDMAAFDRLHAPDFVDRSPGGRAPDREGFRSGLLRLRAAFPDFVGKLEGLVVDVQECTVAVRWTAVGTHKGDYLGRHGAGRRIEFAGIEIIRIDDGRVVERWGEWDGIGLLEQLGAISLPE